MIKINLLPAELLRREEKKLQGIWIGMGVAGFLLLLLAVSGFQWMRAKSLERKLHLVQEELERLKPIVAKVEALEAEKAELQKRLSVVQQLMQGRVLYTHFMEDLVRSLPPTVWFNSLSTQGEGTQVKFQASANALSHTHVADWIRNLEGSGKFNPVELGGVTISNALFNFSLTSTYQDQVPGGGG